MHLAGLFMKKVIIDYHGNPLSAPYNPQHYSHIPAVEFSHYLIPSGKLT